MTDVIDDSLSFSLSLCVCRFILRFRRESKLKSEAAYYFTQIVRPVGWVGQVGGAWCSMGKTQWISVIRSIVTVSEPDWPYFHLLAYVGYGLNGSLTGAVNTFKHRRIKFYS